MARALNAGIKFVTGTVDNGGYRMVGSDGGVFNFGDAAFYGSAASPGSAGWEALASTADGGGYWLFSSTKTEAFGDAAPALSSTGGDASAATIVGASTLYLGDGAPSNGGWFNSVSCPTATLCVAVGQTGPGAGLVEVSNDGGNFFASAAIPAGIPSLSGVACPDATHCFAVGGSTIIASADGGRSWRASPGPSGSTLDNVACQNDTHCTAVGFSSLGGFGGLQGWFEYTTNGAVWAASTGSPSSMNVPHGVSCTSDMCVADGEGVYVSINGGITWVAKNVNGGIDALISVSCIPGSQDCLLIGTNSGIGTSGQLVVTADDGGTFTNVSSRLPLGSDSAQQISCVSPADCSIAGPGDPGVNPSLPYPSLFGQTGDAGGSWTDRPGPSSFFRTPPGPIPLPGGVGISCVSSTSCVMVGYNGSGPAATVTADGGSSWKPSTTQ
jgi:hypothetical protein